MIRIVLIQATDTTLAEEDTDEGRVVHVGPVSHGERERVCVVVWRVTEVDVAVHRQLHNRKNALKLFLELNLTRYFLENVEDVYFRTYFQTINDDGNDKVTLALELNIRAT